MSANAEMPSSLNEQQILMLRLLKTPLPNEDFQQIRRLAVKLLSRQLDELTEDWENKNTITSEQYDKMAKGHFRSK
jgi:capsid portal protein